MGVSGWDGLGALICYFHFFLCSACVTMRNLACGVLRRPPLILILLAVAVTLPLCTGEYVGVSLLDLWLCTVYYNFNRDAI